MEVAGDHGVEEGLVGELDAATEGVAEELAAEVTEEITAACGEEVGAEVCEAADGSAVWEVGAGIGSSGAADGVEALKGEAVGVDALVAADAVGVAAVTLDELALGEVCGGFLGQGGDAFGWCGQFVTEDDFTEPGAA